MNKMIIGDLLKKYVSFRFSIGSGSSEWQDLKGEFEIIDDFVAGSASRQDYASVKKDLLENFYNRLKNLNQDIIAYSPKNSLEENEKLIVKNRVDYGLRILEEISKLI